MQNISRGGENFDSGFNQFKDINDEYTFTNQPPGAVTRLAQPLHISDSNIVVIDSSILSPPNTVALRPGIVSINGERILFYDIDGNNLTRLRRGYGGTGVPQVHLANSDVEDVSSLLETTDWYKPQPEFTFTPIMDPQVEGKELSFKINYKYIMPGTTLWWSNSGTTRVTDFSDSGFVNRGSFITTGDYLSGTFILTMNLKADNYTEYNENIQINIHSSIPPSPAIGISKVYGITDRSITRSIEIISSNVYIDEGQTIHYRINAQGYEDGAILYWKNTGTSRPLNFTSQTEIGEILLNGNYSFASADLFLESVRYSTTDDTKTVVIQLYSDANRQKIIATADAVYIQDIANPSFALYPFKPVIDEGESFGFNIYTNGVPPGSILFCHLTGNAATTVDTNIPSSNNVTTVVNGTIFTGCASISFSSIEDVTTEGWETISCTVYIDENYDANTYAVGPANISVRDTSITPKLDLYSQIGLLSSISFGTPVASTPLTVNEGQSFTITLLTEGIDPGTTIYVAPTNGTATSADFQTLESVYPLVVQGSYYAGSASLNFRVTEDLSPFFVGTPEGTETLILAAYLSNPTIPPTPTVQGTITIEIADTSLETTTTTTTEPPSLAPPPGAVLSKFFNGDFEIPNPQSTDSNGVGHIPGWSIYTPGVSLGVPSHLRMNGFSTILGCPTPNDPTPAYASTPTPYADQDAPRGSNSYSWKVIGGEVDSQFGGKNILELNSQGLSVSYGVVRGPYVVSDNPIQVAAGDNIYFHWKAEGGGDDFDVFGYLIEQDTSNPASCRSIILLDMAGPMYGSMFTSWERAERTIQPGEDGIYKFVFVCGSYDRSGGTWLGARLLLDNIDIIKAAVPAVPWTITTSDSLVQDGGFTFTFNITVPPHRVGGNHGIFLVLPNSRDLFTADIIQNQYFSSGSLVPATASPVYTVITKNFYTSQEQLQILITESGINSQELTRSDIITINPNSTPPAPPPPPPVPLEGGFTLWGSRCPADVGEIQIAAIRGRTNGGTVWGPLSGTDDIFTDDSDWSRAIVHAGLASPGQTVNIKFTCQGDKTGYVGSTKNGVTTNNYGTWCGVKIELA